MGLGKPWPKDAHILLKSGTSSSIISYDLVQNLWLKDSTSTSKRARVQFMFPELSETRIITWNMHVSYTTTKYDLFHYFKTWEYCWISKIRQLLGTR